MLAERPNPLMNARLFWSTVTSNILLWGNASPSSTAARAGWWTTLWPLNPANVTVEWNERRHVSGRPLRGATGRGARAQRRAGAARAGPEHRRIIGDEPHGHLPRGHRGRRSRVNRGQLPPARRDHRGAWSTRRGIKNQRPLRESWNEIYGGSSNANRGHLEEGATIKSVQMPLSDMQFVESAKLSATEIAVLFNAPPGRYGGVIGDSLTYATVEGNAAQWATQTMAPVATNISEALEHDPRIFPFNAWWPEFDLKALMRGDSKARADYYTALKGIGALHPLEAARPGRARPVARGREAAVGGT